MDLFEDEPRQHPRPVPFCQNALLQPVVPEVSLVLQDSFHSQLEKIEKKNDSFSGTEFQTYNSWRWKHMNQNNDQLKNFRTEKVNQSPNSQNLYIIKDKYCTSDTEKRKNEILYGDLDEPRRPLPPRTNAVIPTTIESFLSDMSFDISKSASMNQEKPQKALDHKEIQEKNIAFNYSTKNFKKEHDNSEKLYNIISEQSKQMQVLQKQIDQLLKLQEVKDKQIEQLLNSQDSKDKKIEQLLQSLDFKNKEMKQLLTLKGKQEQNLQELIRSNENKQKENLYLMKKLSELKQKEMQSIGVMTNMQMTDAGTCTNLDDIITESDRKKVENSAEEVSIIRDSSKGDAKEKSLSLHSSDLPVIQEIVPTPQSSIHLEIQDFSDSSDDSETEAGIPSNSLSIVREIKTNPSGFTFYENVLTQLNDIIQNSGENKNNVNNNSLTLESRGYGVSKPNPIVENSGTMIKQSFDSWKVSEKENIPSHVREQERIPGEFPNFCHKDTYSPSDISLKINALALKYLKQEQISQCGLQNQIPTCQHDVTIYNVTNLSIGSMKYLDRYQMLPDVLENQKHTIEYQKHESSPVEFIHESKRMSVQQNITSLGNILDISTLNQQPKLL